MKSLLVLICILSLVLGVKAQEIAKQGAAFAWEKASYDFGDLAQGEKIEHVFKFTNSGSEPLVITNVEVTCGCTTPRGWPKNPIKPGGTGEITIAFDSTGKIGRQNKVITITSNAIGASNQVMISGNVLEKKISN